MIKFENMGKMFICNSIYNICFVKSLLKKKGFNLLASQTRLSQAHQARGLGRGPQKYAKLEPSQ